MKKWNDNMIASVCFTISGLIFLGIAILGGCDYQENVQQAEAYQYEVCVGNWPNYKGIEVKCGDL